MAESGNIIGKVAVLQGHAYIQHPDGSKIELKIGDPIHEGDVVVTGPGAVVEVAFNDGHSYVVHQNETMMLDASVFNTQAVDAHAAAINAQAGQLDELNSVIASGGSLDQLFDSAAAGFAGGGDSNSGHSFVQLLRIVESTDPGSFSLTGGANLANVIAPPETLISDISAPSVTITPFPTINGAEASSNSSIAVTGTVSANVPPGDIVTISVDGHSYTGTVLHGGTYAINVPASVLAGASSDTITASVSIPNSTGGVATTTVSQAYGVELVAPPITVSINAIPTVNGAEAASTNPVNVTGSVSANVPAGDTVTLSVDGHTYTGTVQAGGTYSIAVPGNILANASTDSIHASISSIDAAGNTATATADLPYAVELVAPPISVLINNIPTVNGAEAGSLNPIAVTGSVSSNVPVGQTVTLSVDGHTYSGTVQAGGTYSIGIPGSILANAPVDSIHASVSTTDVAGNIATASADVTYAVELVAPPVSVTINPIATINGVEGTSSNPIAVSGTVSPNVPVGDHVTISVGGQTYTGTVSAGGTYTVGVPGNVLANAPVDSIHATISVTDAAGNTASASADQGYSVDLTGPVISIGLNPLPTVNGAEAASMNPVNITGTVSANVPVGDLVSVTVDGQVFTGTVQAGGTYTIGVPGQILANATSDSIHASVSVTDNAGNTVTAVASESYNVELTAPAITIALNPVLTVNGAEAASVNPVNVTGTVSANVPVGQTVTVTVDGHSYVGTVQAGGTYSIGVPGNILAGASSDNIVANVSTTDAAGNTANASATESYTVELTAPPISISINAIPTVNIAEASSGNPVNVTGTVSANVPVGDTVTLTVDGHTYTGNVQAGGTYSIGVPGNILSAATTDNITATVSMTDAAGNTANAAANLNYAVDLTVPPTPAIAFTSANSNGYISSAGIGNPATVNATITISSAGQTTLANGGSLQVTVDDNNVTQHLTLSINTGGQLVDAANNVYAYSGGVVTLVEAAPGNANSISISATETDSSGNISNSDSASAVEYTPATSPTAAIVGAIGGELSTATTGSTVNATVTLSGAGQASLTSGGSVQIAINDNGTTTNLNLHLNGSGALIDGTGNTYSYNNGVITLTEAAPGNGHTITVTTTETDVTGAISSSNTTSATEYTPVGTAPAVAIVGAVGGDLSTAAISGGNVSATVTLNAAGQATLSSGGSVQVTVVDNGTTSNLNLHLNGSGALVDGSGNIYSYSGGVITLTEVAPGSGHTITVTATETDASNTVSASATASAFEYTPVSAAPAVAIVGAIGGDISTAAISGGNVSATVTLNAAGQATLSSGGSVQVTVVDNGSTSNLNLHLNGSGALVDGSGNTYSYSGGVITLTEVAPGSGNTISVTATETDASNTVSASASASALEYTPVSAAPIVAISGAAGGDISTATINGGNVSATVTLNAAGQATLSSGGSVQVTVVDNGTTSNLNLHLNGSGALVDGSGNTYSYSGGVITLTEVAPGSGNSITVTATETDAGGAVSASSSASALEYTPITSAPAVAITNAVNGELSTATTGATVNATVTLDAAGQASLASSGTVQITVIDAGVTQNLTLHLNGSGVLVDTSGNTYSYTGGVITLTETAPGSGNAITVTATETDAGGLVSASATATANEYTPASATAPSVAIVGAVSNTLTNATLDGATTVNATVTLSATQQSTLASGGSVQLTIVDAGVTQSLNLALNNGSLVDSLGHSYTYSGGVITVTEAAPGNGNAISVSATLTDAAGHATPTGTATATETITTPDTPTVALLANGLVGLSYGVTESQISSPPSGYTALEEVDAYLLTKTTATSTTVPTAFPTAIVAPATGSFIATEINYGLNTTSTSPTTGNEIIGNNLGTSGNLAKWLDVTGTSGPYATNFQTLSGYGTTTQDIVTMTGVVSLPTLGTGQEYAMKIFADDGYQVYVDGKLVATVPANQSGTANYFYFSVPATAGNLHTVQILYWDQGGETSIQASVGTILTANVPASSATTPTLVTPLAIMTPAESGEVTATVTLDSNNQTILTNGGTIKISESNGTNLVLHENSSGHMVDASGVIYTYVNGVIYIPVTTTSTTASISATVVDQYSYSSATAFTGPSISITSDTNHDGYLNAQEVAAETTSGHLSANVNLNAAMLSGGGSATITVVDAGVSTTLSVSSAGVITGTTANVAATYSAGVVSLSLTNPGNGNSATISASQTDQYGHVSTTASSTVVENITAAPAAPTIAITTDANQDGYLSAPELNGGTSVNATITLNSTAQATLSSGGTVQIYVVDNGTTETLNLHLNSSGVLVNAAGVSTSEYSYASGVIALTELAPGNGHSISITATTTDIAGNVSALSTAATAIQDSLDSPVVMVLGQQHATVSLDAADQAVLATTGSTLVVTASDGTNLTLHENTGGQLVDASNAVHSYANGILPLTLSASTPVVNVTATLTDNHGVSSFSSSATLVNSGSNSLTELAGGDTFIFALGANGTPGAPHVETISAFNSNAASSGGDVLNLADLLSGISPSATAATLANYLHFTEVSNGSGGYTTTVHVSSGGAFSSGYSAAQDTLQIVLTNADLLHSAGVLQTDAQIIQSLLTQHKLVD